MAIEHWRTTAAKNRDKAGTRQAAIDKPVLGVIQQVQTETERVYSPDFGGGDPVRVTHPYVSIRSWRRVMPEEETAAVMQQRGDTFQSEISYYWSGAPESRIAKYRAGVNYYRPLDRGEFEDTSFGLAQTFGSRFGSLDQRGGIVRQWLNNTNLEHGSKAPTFVRLQHDHNHDELRGEERFGVVWRKGADHTQRMYPKVNGTNAREYLRILSFGGQPGTLVDYREGHVHEVSGVRALGPALKPLRMRSVFYTADGSLSTDMLDEDGNRWWIFPDTARAGGTMSIPEGPFTMRAGSNITFRTRRDLQMSGANMIVRVTTILHLEADVVLKLISKGMVDISAPTVQINGRVVATNGSPI